MLNFDLEHQSFDGSIEKKKTNHSLKNIVLCGMLISSISLFSGCAEEMECDITGKHAHNYVAENSFARYIVSEKEHVGDYYWTDEYIKIDKDIEKIIEFENKEKLLRISSNKEELDAILAGHDKGLEYRYSYSYVLPIAQTIQGVNGTAHIYYIFVQQTGYSWTTDENHGNLTGETREIYYKYYGYKIVTNDKGKMELSQSELVDSLDELPEDYIYIKEKFYKTFSTEANQEVDYEDGSENDKKLDKEQQAEYEKQLKKSLH